MNILNKLTVKNMLKNRKRLTSTVVAVSLSCALFFIIGFLFSSLSKYNLDMTVKYNGTYHVNITSFKYENLNYIVDNDNIKKYNIYSPIGDTSYNDKYLYFYKLTADTFDNVTVKRGSKPSNKNEILVTEEKLYELGKNLNDEIDVEIDNIQQTYKIVGTYLKQTGFLGSDSSFYNIQNVYVLDDFSNDEYINSVITYNKISDDIVTDTNDIASKLNFLKDDKGKNVGRINYNTSYLSCYGVSTDLGSSITNGMMLFLELIVLTIIAFIGFFIIYNSFEISITERKNNIGILSSIGATPFQIIRSIFTESIIILLMSIGGGLLVSLLFTYGFLEFLNGRLDNILKFPFEIAFNYTYILVSLIFIVLTVFLATLSTSMRARDISPIDSIRNRETIKNKKFKTNKLLLKLFGIESEYARKNMKRNKKKYQVTIISIVISIVLFVTFASVTSYINHIFNFNDPTNKESLRLTLPKKSPLKDQLKSLKSANFVYEIHTKYFSVLDAYQYYSDEYNNYVKDKELLGYIYKKSEHEMFVAYVINDDDYKALLKQKNITYQDIFLFGTFTNNSPFSEESTIQKLYNADEIKALTLCDDKKIYSKVEMKTVIGDCDFTLNNLKTIEGFFKEEILNNRQAFVMSESKYEEIKNHSIEYVNEYDKNSDLYEIHKKIIDDQNTSNEVTLYFDSRDPQKLDKDIKKLFTKNSIDIESEYGGEYSYENNLISYYETIDYLNTFKIAVYLIIGYISLAAITSIYNTIIFSLDLRKREVASLFSVGLTKKGFIKIVFFESLILSFKSIIYSLPFIMIILNGIHKIMNFESMITGKDSFGFSLVTPPYEYILLSFVVVFIIVILTNIFASQKFKNNDIISLIK